jgi:hypothetical protein
VVRLTTGERSGTSGPRTVFRFVASAPPTARDFFSNFQLGRPRRVLAGETEDDWRGLSVFDSVAAGRAMLRRVPRFPLRLVARLEVPPDASLRIEKTYGPGHYTIWGDAQLLLQYVVAVEQIELE